MIYVQSNESQKGGSAQVTQEPRLYSLCVSVIFEGIGFFAPSCHTKEKKKHVEGLSPNNFSKC